MLSENLENSEMSANIGRLDLPIIFQHCDFLCNLHIYCVIIYLMLGYKGSLEEGQRNVMTDGNASSEQTDTSKQFHWLL